MRTYRPLRSAKKYARLATRRQGCEISQRLTEVADGEDLYAAGVAARGRGVVPGRREHDVHVAVVGRDRLLLHAADRKDRAVERDLACRHHLVAAVDVLAELLHDIEREGEPGGRPADVPGVDADVDRKLDRRRRLDDDADE